MIQEKIILGTAQFGMNYGISNNKGQISEKDAHIILDKYLDSGFKYIDTAENYGNAHEILSKFSKKEYLRINTKISNSLLPIDLEKRVETIKESLKIESINTIFFHDFNTFSNNDFNDKLNNIKEKKLVNKIGVSIYSNNELEYFHENRNIQVLQLPFNLLDNESIKGKSIRKLGADIVELQARSIFLQGIFFKENIKDYKLRRVFNYYLELIDRISIKFEINAYELAIRYCLSKEYINKIIIGIDSIEQLNENIKIIHKGKLDSEIIDHIDNIKVKNIEILNPTNWKNL